MTYEQWCQVNGCDHAHCPDGCEKPQPIMDGEVALCGRCLVCFGERVAVVPCNPEVCD